MLQYTTISEGTLGLLKILMSEPALLDFYLVGGTALSLLLGHRKSYDIDMFTRVEFDSEELKYKIGSLIKIIEKNRKLNTLSLEVEYPKDSNKWIKVELIRYNYPHINPLIVEDGLRLLSIEDIIPMKLSSIVNRGVKRDFFDIYFLLKYYSIAQMLELYDKKFEKNSHLHVLKSLTYFDDAEQDEEPILIKIVDWSTVKKTITDAVKLIV